MHLRNRCCALADRSLAFGSRRALDRIDEIGQCRFDVAADCFRREPSKHLDRLQSFRMREYVCIGTPQDVADFRERWMVKAQAIARDLGLAANFDAYVAAVRRLADGIGIPRRIGEIGVRRQDFERLAVMALPDFNAGCNPRPLDVPSLVSILEASDR